MSKKRLSPNFFQCQNTSAIGWGEKNPTKSHYSENGQTSLQMQQRKGLGKNICEQDKSCNLSSHRQTVDDIY